MKRYFTAALVIVTFACLQYGCSSSSSMKSGQTKTVADRYGLIHVKGNTLVDKNGDTLQLHGMSLFWSQWGGKYFNENCIQWLKDDWKCTVVRAAMGVEAGG